MLTFPVLLAAAATAAVAAAVASPLPTLLDAVCFFFMREVEIGKIKVKKGSKNFSASGRRPEAEK